MPFNSIFSETAAVMSRCPGLYRMRLTVRNCGFEIATRLPVVLLVLVFIIGLSSRAAADVIYEYDSAGRVVKIERKTDEASPPVHINIGSKAASGTNNVVAFTGFDGSKCLHVNATCTGEWWVDPCEWQSRCSTGWQYKPGDIREVAISECSECNIWTYHWTTGAWGDCSGKTRSRSRTVVCTRSDGVRVADSFCPGQKPAETTNCYVNIGNRTSSGVNNAVEFIGYQDGKCIHGYATCVGQWSVNPCAWASSCSTGWVYDPKDYYKIKDARGCADCK